MRLVAQPRQWRTGQCIEGTAAGAALRRLLDDIEYTLESGCRLQQCQQVRTLAPCQTVEPIEQLFKLPCLHNDSVNG